VSSTQRLCADCQRLRITPLAHWPRPLCAAPNFLFDPVMGDPQRDCVRERILSAGVCGISGVLFQKRDPGTWQAWLSRPGVLLDAGYTL
jgi:hypothetical protein